MNYAVKIQKAKDGGFGASCPSLPGCAATGSTLEEVKASMKEAIVAHVGRLRQMGRDMPEPTTVSWHIVN